MSNNWTEICGGCGKKISYAATCLCKKEFNRKRNQLKNEQNIEATIFYKSAKWRKFRRRIIERDEGICIRCFLKGLIVTSNLEVHHIKPRSQYPELAFDESNCITLCKSCNTHLGTKGELDFKWEALSEYDNVPVL